MNIEKNKDLSQLTTFKIGGPARYFISVKDLKSIEDALEFQAKNQIPYFVLGGGSNLLVSDSGFDGLIIKPDIDFLEIIEESPNRIIANIGAGKSMNELVYEMCNLGFKGLEWAGGLPGTLGGAIRGNAGCFKGEMKDNILEVSAINLKTKEIKNFNNKDCQFDYRGSFFKKNQDWLIISVKLIFQKNNKDELLKSMNEKIDYRKRTQPLEFPNAGSIFKNFSLDKSPIELKTLAEENKVIKTDPFAVIPTAFIINECGLKGKEIGGAKISDKHPNFIVNFNNAKAQNVTDLINLVKDVVYSKFNILLEEEIQII